MSKTTRDKVRGNVSEGKALEGPLVKFCDRKFISKFLVGQEQGQTQIIQKGLDGRTTGID